jgi:asparagine synthase (glutamine-hydrolysing)
MCGICGVMYFDNTEAQVSPTFLEGMVSTMKHRGPDGEGVWVSNDGKVGLGHARLSIIDLSVLGAQPMANEDGTVQITFNGEIYNHQKLRSNLEKKGYYFKSQCDTEAIIHQFEECGSNVVNFLDGVFAFAIYKKDERTLFLARDRIGVKPLYYAKMDNFFIFASDIRAILQHPDISAEVDDEALYHYLTYFVTPPPKTLFKNIFKLPAGHFLKVSYDGQVSKHEYWDALPRQYPIDNNHIDEQFTELFENAVEKRLMSDVPIGVLFSGGVDSTLNTIAFAKHQQSQVQTFNVGFENTRSYSDESNFATEMATILGTKHHSIKVSEREFIEFMPQIPYYQGEPVSDPACIPSYFATKYAKEKGITVAHVGEGADEIFCGYDSYRRFLKHEKYLWRPLGYSPKFMSLAIYHLMDMFLPKNNINRKIIDIIRRKNLGQEFYMSSMVAYYEYDKQKILSPEFRDRMANFDSFDVVNSHYKKLKHSIKSPSFYESMSYLGLKLTLPELLLMRVDKLSMANSVEARVPFLDYRLVEFALSAPQAFILHNGISKAPVKRLAAKTVPRDRIYREKSGFGSPVQEWFGSLLGEYFRHLLEKNKQDLEEYLDVEYLINKSRAPMKTVNDSTQLWNILDFVQWYDYYIA